MANSSPYNWNPTTPLGWRQELLEHGTVKPQHNHATWQKNFTLMFYSWLSLKIEFIVCFSHTLPRHPLHAARKSNTDSQWLQMDRTNRNHNWLNIPSWYYSICLKQWWTLKELSVALQSLSVSNETRFMSPAFLGEHLSQKCGVIMR